MLKSFEFGPHHLKIMKIVDVELDKPLSSFDFKDIDLLTVD